MSSRKSHGKASKEPLPGRDQAVQREILGVVLIAIGSVTLLALLSVTRGALSAAWVLFLRRFAGWGVFPVALGLIAGGLLVLWEDLRQRFILPPRAAFGLEAAFLALLGLSHLAAASQPQALALAERGGGGGYVGWTVSYLLAAAMGRAFAFVVLLSVAVAGLALFLGAVGTDPRPLLDWATNGLRQLFSSVESAEPAAETPVLKERKRSARKAAAPLPEPPKVTGSKSQPAPPPRRRRDRALPPLDLLDGSSNEPYGDADMRYKRQVIEETLLSFGVPVRVVEVNQGPTVTQFGVEPGFTEFPGPDGKPRRRKVKVSKIMALQDDLALALAASPIRVEAPVPGRSVVGIEVPNTKVALVSLRNALESRAFRGLDSKLRIALGQNVAGQSVVADLGQMPHLLIAGATGSGKSVCINAITACLLLNNTPDDLQVIMVDPKMVELTMFNGIPHLVAPVITAVEEVVRALRWVTTQMDERYRLFSRAGARNIDAYNRSRTARGEDKLPYMIVLIDELADLMMVAPDEVERSICRIAQLARATGIHLVIATQRPSVDVVTGLIKANFPARISFAVTSQIDSRVILDTGGAEKLLGRGDMLYMSSDSSKLLRLQGCFVSDAELERLVRFWREKTDWIAEEPAAPPPWKNVELDQDKDDELLEQAIELARGRESVSTSFIQRRLRIGYPRAAHLVDQLEDQGVVGPAENAGRSRRVLPRSDGAAVAEEEAEAVLPYTAETDSRNGPA